MTLYKAVRDDIAKYEDIKRTEFKGVYFYMFYDVNGVEKFKRIPYRAGKELVIKRIQQIRAEIDYYKRKEERIESGYYDNKNKEPAFSIGDENE